MRERMSGQWGMVLTLASCLIAGCVSGGPKTSRIQADDLAVTVDEIVAQLSGSELLAGRTETSEQMRIVVGRVENRSSDVIPSSEMWLAMARVQGAMPVQTLARERNIIFQLPPEQVRRLEARGFDVTLPPEHRATHELRAVFSSATRSAAVRSEYTDLRKDYYYLEYQIVDLQSRELEWTGRFEFAREAVGNVID